MQQQVAGETENSAEFGGCCDAAEYGHRAALGEAAEHDAIGGYTGVDFGFYEGVEVISGLENTWFVLASLEVAEIGLEEEGC